MVSLSKNYRYMYIYVNLKWIREKKESSFNFWNAWNIGMHEI